MIGKKRGAVMSGGRVNLQKAAELVLTDFRDVSIGRITLETPAEFEVWLAEGQQKDAERQARKDAQTKARRSARRQQQQRQKQPRWLRTNQYRRADEPHELPKLAHRIVRL